MSEYFVQHFLYLKSLNYEQIEKATVDWSAYRVPFNYANKIVKVNPALSEEEFEREQESPYKLKKYHFSFRRPEEITEENLQKTYVNLGTMAFFHNKEKTVRQENLNLDSMSSQERDRVIYDMKMELQKFSEQPNLDSSFFSPSNLSPTGT